MKQSASPTTYLLGFPPSLFADKNDALVADIEAAGGQVLGQDPKRHAIRVRVTDPGPFALAFMETAASSQCDADFQCIAEAERERLRLAREQPSEPPPSPKRPALRLTKALKNGPVELQVTLPPENDNQQAVPLAQAESPPAPPPPAAAPAPKRASHDTCPVCQGWLYDINHNAETCRQKEAAAVLALPAAEPPPVHGQRRDYGEQTVYGNQASMVGPNGETVYEGPMSSHTFSVSQTYCGKCCKWIQTNGIGGRLTFMGTHDVGECDKVLAPEPVPPAAVSEEPAATELLPREVLAQVATELEGGSVEDLRSTIQSMRLARELLCQQLDHWKQRALTAEARLAAAPAAVPAAVPAATTSPRPAAPRPPAAPRGEGVIATIWALVCRPEGATADEVEQELVRRFPDRPLDSMRSTMKVQLGSRLKAERAGSWTKTDESPRGTVYRATAK